MKEQKYKWNDKVGNFCVIEKGEFITPLETLKLSEVDKESLAESLQTIHFKRTGTINYEIGLDYEKDKAIAKAMSCWE